MTLLHGVWKGQHTGEGSALPRHQGSIRGRRRKEGHVGPGRLGGWWGSARGSGTVGSSLAIALTFQ